MPAKSRKQLRFLYAVASGKSDSDMKPSQAKEWIAATPNKSDLPAQAPKRKNVKLQ